MGQQYQQLSDKLQQFISGQKIFFVATTAPECKINLSPKGMDSLRLLSPTELIWLNVTGSGNETAAHVQVDSRMTIMFAAFEGDPMILRLYGQAEVIHPGDKRWADLLAHFKPLPGARQIFHLHIELVQTSCGMAVPFFDYAGERDQLNEWARKKGEQGLRDYWQQKNQRSMDGLPSHIVDKSSS